MRKNATAALSAFAKGHALRPSPSIHTDGETLFSYDTALAVMADAQTVVLNATRYSATTSTQQHAVRMHAHYGDLTVIEVKPEGRRVTGADLLALAFPRVLEVAA